MSTHTKIVAAKVEVTLDDGKVITYELEHDDGRPIEGSLNTETEAIEDPDESWAKGWVEKRPGRTSADIRLSGWLKRGTRRRIEENS